ncbi:tetratricopeptide repeat protein [Neobacillus terrae]|uniref:tetratricopeptide repeat protein n=1 Tax=Neobacillus terrae TaxID=3034837 RepID=UPI00140D1E60|nr:tetratricopeptide repeat protein [Neobacillus terrae]NHM29945.1 tetratricopeptide repeat protein [Neobacillus terrae]
MESQVQINLQEEASSTEKNKKPKKQKKNRFKCWQSLILLVATLAISLSAGYYFSNKYLWNKNADQIEKQLDYYKMQVNEKPNDPTLRVQLGYTYFLKGDTDSAIKEYQTAKSLDKNFYEAYLNLSIAYDKEKRTDDALQMAAKAVKLSPRDYKSHLLLGRSYRKLKMYKEATKSLEEAARLKPGNTDVVYEVGMTAEAQGKKKEAEKIYKETLTYDPTFKPAITALDRLNGKDN